MERHHCVWDSAAICQCRALTAVASVAKTAEADFGRYYDAFIPGIKAIVAATSPKAGTEREVCSLLCADDRTAYTRKQMPQRTHWARAFTSLGCTVVESRTALKYFGGCLTIQPCVAPNEKYST